MNVSAKVTSKGQITLPVELRKALRLKAGDTIDFRLNDKGNYEVVAKRYTLEDLRGFIKLDGPPRTIEQIIEDIDAARTSRADEIVRRMQADERE